MGDRGCWMVAMGRREMPEESPCHRVNYAPFHKLTHPDSQRKCGIATEMEVRVTVM